MSPLPPQTLISNQLNYLAKHGGIRWEHVPASMATFNLLLNVCGKEIVWQVRLQLWSSLAERLLYKMMPYLLSITENSID